MQSQEQEHRDYLAGEFQNEQQAAYASAKAEGLTGRDPHIDKELKAGKYVVIEETPVYCPHTDGLLGTRERLIESCDTEGRAREVAGEYWESLGGDPAGEDDVRVSVTSSHPEYNPEDRFVGNDDIPF